MEVKLEKLLSLHDFPWLKLFMMLVMNSTDFFSSLKIILFIYADVWNYIIKQQHNYIFNTIIHFKYDTKSLKPNFNATLQMQFQKQFSRIT